MWMKTLISQLKCFTMSSSRLQACCRSSQPGLSRISSWRSVPTEPGWETIAALTSWTTRRSPRATASSPHPHAAPTAWERRRRISSAARWGGIAHCASTGTSTWKPVCGSSAATTTCPSCLPTAGVASGPTDRLVPLSAWFRNSNVSLVCPSILRVCLCACVYTDRTAPYLFDQYFAFHSVHVHVCLPDFSEHIETRNICIFQIYFSKNHSLGFFLCSFKKTFLNG